uniref:DDB1-and CUL4-associated factor 17-like protein n=1 Tax=Callorhinchus milii TaxID=7868 RepID=V9KN91_CALMI
MRPPGVRIQCSKQSTKILRIKHKNNCCILSARSLGLYGNEAGSLYRKNMIILQHLVCQKTTTFESVWAKQSNSTVSYEKGRIYFDNYRCCFSSIGPRPTLLYELPKRHESEKIEDALLCECPVEEMLPKPSDHKPCLITVTASNWLMRICTSTAEILEKVHLSSQWKFRYLAWETTRETIVVKTTHNKLTPAARAAGMQQSALFYLILFNVLPLTLIGMLDINKKVFGNNVTDATISEGLLIVTFSTGLVRFYSCQWIIEKFMQKQLVLGETCDWNGTTGIVGMAPFGIPCNIQITDCPPVLFEVSCLENALQIGGQPWHYISTPNKRSQKGIYHICALQDKTLAENGIQEMQCCSLETDWIYFHPDTSGRIMHVGPTQINVLQLTKVSEDTQRRQVLPAFTIFAEREKKVESSETVTASGRVVKRRFTQLDDDPEFETFKMVDYEDELDLLAVLTVGAARNDGSAHLDLYDNQTGILVKRVPIKEPWDVTYSHQLSFDRDTIVHIEQQSYRTICCHVYKMVQHSPDDGNKE